MLYILHLFNSYFTKHGRIGNKIPNPIAQLLEKLRPLTLEIINHQIYSQITSIETLRLFMEQHVFAVWDFMCLLKELYRSIVSTASPWFPPKDALSANLIGSILTEEEGDLAEDGLNYLSHFEIYVTAMEKIGAATDSIKKLLTLLKNGYTIQEALAQLTISPMTRDFVLTTFSFFKLDAHELAAAFVYGREGITAGMFIPILKQLETKNSFNQQQLSTLVYYFKRHIELDNGEHYPKALRMLSNLIGNNEKKLYEAEEAAAKALTARINFLTGIQQLLIISQQTLG